MGETLISFPRSFYIEIKKSEEGIVFPSSDIKIIFVKCMKPIWNYGKNDTYIQSTFLKLFQNIKAMDLQNFNIDIYYSLEERNSGI